MELTRDAARALRDGGIDALGALDSALANMLVHLPEEAHLDVRRVVGHLRDNVLLETVRKAVSAYPELEADREVWAEAILQRLEARLLLWHQHNDKAP
ncbi:hypothetical protein A167_00215 [Alcanivorax sp. S71-1-4]|uniref:hypothetical protein n=1 Tax=Alcanivorax sp. S71-1-4 TaxID=1177159 RepID=UPI00135A518F|nr:hypothetical protein [Alcanivorax sp. S71-1-4]KAF0811183.1 hypothetical protein A167_00215 [Alcanivorax sp. S71-1-4]